MGKSPLCLGLYILVPNWQLLANCFESIVILIIESKHESEIRKVEMLWDVQLHIHIVAKFEAEKIVDSTKMVELET